MPATARARRTRHRTRRGVSSRRRKTDRIVLGLECHPLRCRQPFTPRICEQPIETSGRVPHVEPRRTGSRWPRPESLRTQRSDAAVQFFAALQPSMCDRLQQIGNGGDRPSQPDLHLGHLRHSTTITRPDQVVAGGLTAMIVRSSRRRSWHVRERQTTPSSRLPRGIEEPRPCDPRESAADADSPDSGVRESGTVKEAPARTFSGRGAIAVAIVLISDKFRSPGAKRNRRQPRRRRQAGEPSRANQDARQ